LKLAFTVQGRGGEEIKSAALQGSQNKTSPREPSGGGWDTNLREGHHLKPEPKTLKEMRGGTERSRPNRKRSGSEPNLRHPAVLGGKQRGKRGRWRSALVVSSPTLVLGDRALARTVTGKLRGGNCRERGKEASGWNASKGTAAVSAGSGHSTFGGGVFWWRDPSSSIQCSSGEGEVSV